MIELVGEAIDNADLTASVKRRLKRCLPPLQQALANTIAIPAPGTLAIAAATANGCLVMEASGWPQIEGDAASREDVAAALPALIESSTYEGDALLTGLTILLGQAGVSEHDEDAKRITAAGELPLTVLLVEGEGSVVSTLVTLVALVRPRLH